MPEFETRRPALPPFFPPARPAAGASDDEFESTVATEAAPQREGLPPGYRMRHDSHYVDQLTARTGQPQVRTLAIRDIDATRSPDAREVEPLVRSIAKYGVLQPLIVRSRGGRFELIAGARRLRAAVLAGLTEVPSLVHTCDDTRAQALAEAENLRVEPSAGPAAGAHVASSGLTELAQSFGTIDSCLHLLVSREGSLRDRVALDLVRTEVHRSHRLVQSLQVLSQEPALSLAPVPVGAALDEVLERFGPERRLGGVQVELSIGEGPHLVEADPEWLSVGLAAAIGGMLALVQTAKMPALQVRLTGTASGPSIMLEIAQHAVTVPAWALGRLFDATWTDRPGGGQAAVEFAAARRIVELHHGGIEVLTGERGGCRVVVVLPTVA